jgi:hypothetical protein
MVAIPVSVEQIIVLIILISIILILKDGGHK